MCFINGHVSRYVSYHSTITLQFKLYFLISLVFCVKSVPLVHHTVKNSLHLNMSFFVTFTNLYGLNVFTSRK
jgi:hypothetical protein